MIRKIREARENEEGFTLIELLVVVIIIGILAAIAIPAFLNQRERAWQSELTSTLRNVALDVEAEATALNGDYSAITDGTSFQSWLTTATNTLQGGATPVTLTVGNVSATQFCIIGTHASLQGPPVANQVYESDEGGLSDFSVAGTAACVD